MRVHRPLLALLVAGGLGLPGTVQAQTSSYEVTPASGCVNSTLVPDDENVVAVRRATQCLINDERASRGLRPLVTVPSLQSAATEHARRMVRQRFFEHTSPDGDTFLSRIKRTSYLQGGLKGWSVGENIAWGSGRLATPSGIVKAWMASPGHRRNILSRSFDELGLGIATGAPLAGAGRRAATYVNEFGERRR